MEADEYPQVPIAIGSVGAGWISSAAEKKLYAQQIKIKRENELIVQDNGLINKNSQKADFVKWFEKYAEQKSHNRLYKQTLNYLKKYLGNRPLTFQAVTPDWIKSFITYLFTNMPFQNTNIGATTLKFHMSESCNSFNELCNTVSVLNVQLYHNHFY